MTDNERAMMAVIDSRDDEIARLRVSRDNYEQDYWRATVERDEARAEVERLRTLVREAEGALSWAISRSPEDAGVMVQESRAWLVRARAALEGKP